MVTQSKPIAPFLWSNFRECSVSPSRSSPFEPEQLDTIALPQVRDSLSPIFEPGQRGLPAVKDASHKPPNAFSEADCVEFAGYVTFDLSACLAETGRRNAA
jgi:hypothetical protein